jgi:1-acyl-sn-glycerol-3-phosphate acyltransferase
MLVVTQRSLLTAATEWAIAGLITGFVLSLLVQGFLWWATTTYRMMGLAIPASTALVLGLGLTLTLDQPGFVSLFLVWFGGFGCVFTTSRFVTQKLGDDPSPALAEYRRTLALYRLASAVPLFGQAVFVFVYGIGTLQGWPVLTEPWFQRLTSWYFFGIAAFLCVWCWLRLFRPFVELCCEMTFLILYAIRSSGPGVKTIPPFGPVLVIANHACWFDPLFVGKYIPRPITAMMTESFYRIWFLRPLLQQVYRVIVVRETHARREAPELQGAIEALRRGECVVMFPEGYLRRKEEMILRRFAQGVWRILSACPDTPVVSCWVEGGWESTFSWRNGPPWKDKPLDIRKPIRVGISVPEVVPRDILADQLATRIHLMNRVSAARAYIGMEPLPTFEVLKVGADEKQTTQTE